MSKSNSERSKESNKKWLTKNSCKWSKETSNSEILSRKPKSKSNKKNKRLKRKSSQLDLKLSHQSIRLR